MGMTMISDQDAPFSKSATTDPGVPGDYDKETREVGYSIAEYYLFSRTKFQKPILWRLLIWEAWSFFTGAICYFVPFFSYGYGVANKFGKTEDLYAASFAAIIANIMITHV